MKGTRLRSEACPQGAACFCCLGSAKVVLGLGEGQATHPSSSKLVAALRAFERWQQPTSSMLLLLRLEKHNQEALVRRHLLSAVLSTLQFAKPLYIQELIYQSQNFQGMRLGKVGRLYPISR